ncbi:MAG TPA: 3'(2'),5'-bisphosphate nucleotidase CysQ [Albidovulum sp.]|uniref:3'(2'),5'-bisphosphate nucleotidase CysQ n=1 Tax=Albidovulum sp. TaxID=1872424 RepID=UPI002CE90AD7|nr:3'(2'),5'-bisphosphate nucleotidase CysQ [Albidovulum sp.]
MPAPDRDLLIGAAEEAGRIARRFWRNKPETWVKPGDAGPVTEADLAIDAMLKAELRAARPDYGWLSEETPDDPARLAHDRCFIIDPIDGTRAFIEGDTSFAHALAVAERGRVTAGVVYLPEKDALYAATEDRPATLNGQPISATNPAQAEGATVLTSSATMAPQNWKGAVPPVQRVFRASFAWRLCLVAEGRYDAALTLRPSWEWDIAAGDLIARQAGAMVSDRTGAALVFNRPDPRADGVIAAGPRLWQDLRSQLADAGSGS